MLNQIPNEQQEPANAAQELLMEVMNSPEFEKIVREYAAQLADFSTPEFQALVQETALSLLPGDVLPAHTAFTRSPIGTVRMATDTGELMYECSCDAKSGTILVRSHASGKWFRLPLPVIVEMAQHKGVDVRESLLQTHQPESGLIIHA